MDGPVCFVRAHYLRLLRHHRLAGAHLAWHNLQQYLRPAIPAGADSWRDSVGRIGAVSGDIPQRTIRATLDLDGRAPLADSVFCLRPGGLLGDGQAGLLAILVPVTYGSTAVVLVYRYRRVFTQVERQQTKWVVFGVGMGVLLVIVSSIPTLVFPELDQPDSPYQVLGGLLFALLFLSIPLSVGIAILRYRLWDIDTLINKALVYGLLTALLGTLYVGLIIGLASLAGAITSSNPDQQPVALVISTLAIAALFQPVRHRLQAIIDRRFYRRKYDAEKALAAFSATLRSEVDLEQVRVQLLAVVQETMQPAHVSLWLRQPERSLRDLAHRQEPQGQAPTRASPD